MNSQLNYYELLGVASNATSDEIRAKFHELARVFHPDRQDDKDTAQRVFIRINAAYGTLVDPQKRANYDKKLRAAGGKHDVAMGTSASSQVISAISAQQIQEWVKEAHTVNAKGSHAKAIELCERALFYDALEWSAYAMLGDIQAELGKTTDAIDAYHKALYLNPSSKMTREKLRRLECPVERPHLIEARAWLWTRLIFRFRARQSAKHHATEECTKPAENHTAH